MYGVSLSAVCSVCTQCMVFLYTYPKYSFGFDETLFRMWEPTSGAWWPSLLSNPFSGGPGQRSALRLWGREGCLRTPLKLCIPLGNDLAARVKEDLLSALPPQPLPKFSWDCDVTLGRRVAIGERVQRQSLASNDWPFAFRASPPPLSRTHTHTRGGSARERCSQYVRKTRRVNNDCADGEEVLCEWC